MKKKTVYFAIHKGAFENGSFYRPLKNGRFAHYMNGDYMGDVDSIPSGLIKFEK